MTSTQLVQSLYAQLHQMPAPPPGTENGIPLFYRFVRKFSLYFLSLSMYAFHPASWNFHFIQLHLYFGSMRYFGKSILLKLLFMFFPPFKFPPFQCCSFLCFFFSPTSVPSSLLLGNLAALTAFIVLINKHYVHFWGKMWATDTYYITFLGLP